MFTVCQIGLVYAHKFKTEGTREKRGKEKRAKTGLKTLKNASFLVYGRLGTKKESQRYDRIV